MYSMYNMSQGSYMPSSSASPLEYIANSSPKYFSKVSDPFTGTTPNYFIPQSTPESTFVYHCSQDLSYSNKSYISFTPQVEYSFEPQHFLKPGKEGKFVGEAEEIESFVREAFKIIFAEEFPDDIKVSVLNDNEFSKLTKSRSVLGLSINRREQGLLSEIFVKADNLARVMLTIGHELGHVLTPTLMNSHDEEAKAYAFSFLWMQTMKKHDIANLREAIVTENPADNGLHDVAFFFVDKLRRAGKSVAQIYRNIVDRKLSVPSVGF